MKAVNINFLYFNKVFNTVSKSKFLNKLSNHDINKFATLGDELAQWQSHWIIVNRAISGWFLVAVMIPRAPFYGQSYSMFLSVLN